MNIGEPERVLTIEPIVSPVQQLQLPAALEADQDDPRPDVSEPEMLEIPR
jgi:hypothetical protein